MPLKPLDILKKGYAKLEQDIKSKKAKLSAKLSQGETISTSEEQWLDNDGNLIDEQQTLDILESASNYESAVAELDEGQKAIVKKLRQLAGDLAPEVPAKKRTRTYFITLWKLTANKTFFRLRA